MQSALTESNHFQGSPRSRHELIPAGNVSSSFTQPQFLSFQTKHHSKFSFTHLTPPPFSFFLLKYTNTSRLISLLTPYYDTKDPSPNSGLKFKDQTFSKNLSHKFHFQRKNTSKLKTKCSDLFGNSQFLMALQLCSYILSFHNIVCCTQVVYIFLIQV